MVRPSSCSPSQRKWIMFNLMIVCLFQVIHKDIFVLSFYRSEVTWFNSSNFYWAYIFPLTFLFVSLTFPFSDRDVRLPLTILQNPSYTIIIHYFELFSTLLPRIHQHTHQLNPIFVILFYLRPKWIVGYFIIRLTHQTLVQTLASILF